MENTTKIENTMEEKFQEDTETELNEQLSEQDESDTYTAPTGTLASSIPTGGHLDVTGIEIIRINDVSVTTKEEAIASYEISSASSMTYIEVDGEKFLIKTTISDINKINSLDPHDLENAASIQIQLKVAEILKNSGLDIKINDEEVEAARDELKKEEDKLNEIAPSL